MDAGSNTLYNTQDRKIILQDVLHRPENKLK